MVSYIIGGIIVLGSVLIIINQVRNSLKGKTSCSGGCSGCSGHCNIKEK